MSNYNNLIKNTTLLSSLPDETILTHLSNGSFRLTSYEKNSIIHFDGEPCHKLEIILVGRVVVERIDKSGNLLTISNFYSDDILGGNLVFSRNPYYNMTISTKSPTTILEIDKEILFDLLGDNSSFLRTYLEFISDNAFPHYVNRTIRESVLSYLDYQSKKQNSNHIKLNITKTALAEKMGVQRTSLSRELSKMKKDGLITFDADSITLLE